MTHFIFLFHKKNIFLNLHVELSFIICSEIMSLELYFLKILHFKCITDEYLGEINHFLNLLLIWTQGKMKYFKIIITHHAIS